MAYNGFIEKRYIIGQWHSLNIAAYANGAFIYTIAARGSYMCGYEVAPNENGKIMYREVYFGKSEEDIEKAKKWMLIDMRL